MNGDNGTVIRKKDFLQSKSTSQGFVNLVFYHEAAQNDTSIDLSALNLPAGISEVNPSPSRLLDAKLFQFRNNLTLQSSLHGVLQKGLSYRVNSNSTIKLNYDAVEGEIFTGTLTSNPTDGLKTVAAKLQYTEYDLSDAQTDVPIGFSTTTSRVEIVVSRNGMVQKRNTNNSSTVDDGNYYVVDSGSGFGTVVRFNEATSGEDDHIQVMALGNIIENPTDSTWDEIEKLQGQLDAVIPTLAALAGVDESDFQAAPNNIDLKQFGARVLQAEKDIQAIEDERADPASKIQSAFGSAGGVTSDDWESMGGGVTLQPGIYRLDADLRFVRTSGSGLYTQMYALWCTEDGDGTNTQPQAVTGDSKINVLHGNAVAHRNFKNASEDGSERRTAAIPVIIQVLETVTIYAPMLMTHSGGSWVVESTVIATELHG